MRSFPTKSSARPRGEDSDWAELTLLLCWPRGLAASSMQGGGKACLLLLCTSAISVALCYDFNTAKFADQGTIQRCCDAELMLIDRRVTFTGEADEVVDGKGCICIFIYNRASCWLVLGLPKKKEKNGVE